MARKSRKVFSHGGALPSEGVDGVANCLLVAAKRSGNPGHLLAAGASLMSGQQGYRFTSCM
jgi:hypothetical protein